MRKANSVNTRSSQSWKRSKQNVRSKTFVVSTRSATRPITVEVEVRWHGSHGHSAAAWTRGWKLSLKTIYADLSLENRALKDVIEKKVW